jgi:hypothetical protein
LTKAGLRVLAIVLDPLVRLHRGEENAASEISELLGFLRGLQRETTADVRMPFRRERRARDRSGEGHSPACGEG